MKYIYEGGAVMETKETDYGRVQLCGEVQWQCKAGSDSEAVEIISQQALVESKGWVRHCWVRRIGTARSSAPCS